jgi:anti-sigma regulatory factor (Ser/Thr protein kinase)
VRTALVVDVVRGEQHDVLRLTGRLSLETVLAVRAALGELLADRGRVVVDLAAVALDWPPAVEVFRTALSAAGGWPAARLALYGASPELAAALRRGRVAHAVPLVADLAAAHEAVDARPARVSRQVDLPCHPEAAACARVFVQEVCTDWGVGELRERALLVASELVSNAMEHARSACRVTVSLDARGLHVGVRDHSTTGLPRPAPVDPTAPRGRGLHLISTMTGAWGVTEHADGKTVWASLAP